MDSKGNIHEYRAVLGMDLAETEQQRLKRTRLELEAKHGKLVDIPEHARLAVEAMPTKDRVAWYDRQLKRTERKRARAARKATRRRRHR